MRDGFDWVTAHAKCTADMMLAALSEGINRDVEKRNALITGVEPRFRAESDLAAGTVVVHRSEPADREQYATVQFQATERRILITGYRINGVIRVRVGLDSAGQCSMELEEGEPISKVQLRMQVLGGLFFA